MDLLDVTLSVRGLVCRCVFKSRFRSHSVPRGWGYTPAPGLCVLAIRAPHKGHDLSFRWGESHWYPRSLDLRKGDQGSTEFSDPPSWGGGTWAEGSGTPRAKHGEVWDGRGGCSCPIVWHLEYDCPLLLGFRTYTAVLTASAQSCVGRVSASNMVRPDSTMVHISRSASRVEYNPVTSR